MGKKIDSPEVCELSEGPTSELLAIELVGDAGGRLEKVVPEVPVEELQLIVEETLLKKVGTGMVELAWNDHNGSRSTEACGKRTCVVGRNESVTRSSRGRTA